MLRQLSQPAVAILVAASVMAQLSCREIDPEMSQQMNVAVSVLPQKFFVEYIAGDSIDVMVIVPPGANPASHEPTPSDMRRFSRVDVWFTIGVSFEIPWIPRLVDANEDVVICNTIAGIQRLPINRYGITDFEEGTDPEHHGHSHGTDDPHVWLSPQLVLSQAEIIAGGLSRQYQADSILFMENLQTFNTRIHLLQDSIHSLLAENDGRGFIVFHPAWGYFADEFNLIQIPIEVAGSDPSPGEMALIVDTARERGISVIFVSPQFSISSAETIASEIDADVLILDPLSENWEENLISVARSLSESWGDP